MTDQILYCRDCNQEFTFITGEQEFYASRGLTNAPSRCPECRAARKQTGGSFSRQGGISANGKHARCTRQRARVVEKKPWFLLSRAKIVRCIVASVISHARASAMLADRAGNQDVPDYRQPPSSL